MKVIIDILNRIGFTKDTAVRALKTFLQAFLAYILTALTAGGCFDSGVTKNVLIGVFMSAVAAGVSAVMNMISKRAK